MTPAVWPLVALLLGTGEATPTLGPGVLVEGELGGGETRSWLVELGEAGAWKLTAEQRGVDLALEVLAPTGERLLAVDNPLDRRGEETLLLETEAAGSYRVQLRGLETGAPRGRFRLHLEPVALGRLEGERATAVAGRSYLEGSPTGWRAAAEQQSTALEAWRALGAEREAARALTCLAVLHRLLGERSAAAAHAEAALAAWRELDDRAEEAALLGELGLVRWQMGEIAAARELFAASLALGRELGEGFAAATAAANLCLMDLVEEKLRAGLACYDEALPRLTAVGAPRLEAAALVNVGRVHDLLGDPQQALESYRRAQRLQQLAGDRKGEAQTLNNLGVLSRQLGDTETALASYSRALGIFRELGSTVWQARVLNNVGNAYRGLGQLEQARAYFDQALPLWRQAGDRAGEATSLDNLGQVARETGEPAVAITLHRQSLDLSRALGAARGAALTLQSLARAQLAVGERANALAALDRALELLRSVGDRANEAQVLRQRGELHLAGGEVEAARTDLEQSLETARATGQRSNEAAALAGLARAERRLAQLADAREHAMQAVAIAETLRTRFANPDLRTALSAVWHDAYELLIDLLMESHRQEPAAGWGGAALETSERARARTLLELLQEAGAAIDTDADPALLEKRSGLELRLAARAERALDRRRASAQDQAADAAEGSALGYELDVVEAEIRRQSPRFAALTQPRPLAVVEIQALLETDTLMLVYSLGETRSFLWLVETGAIEVFELPGRAVIEKAARALHEQLAVFDPAARGADHTAAVELSRLVLGPVEARLGARRLAVVADGALHYVPFGVLPLRATGEPVVARHEVVELASASALALQRRSLAERAPAPKWLAVVADPVFDGSDERVAGLPGDGGVVRESAVLERLVASRHEAETLAALAPPEQVLAALGFEASRERVLGDGLAGYRVVHFATHGIIDAANPALSGLVLSRVDRQGRPQPGFLGLRDVYDLRLGAELVVLSGCRTALGKEVRGEGLVGLVRGFLFAGARRVVASLWRVEDRATAELMVRFYRAMELRGASPAAALRSAQLEIRAERRWRDPYFWAGFVLVGDWR